MSNAALEDRTPGRSVAAGFEEPFALLEACHERVRRSLGPLERLVTHLQAQGNTPQAA